MSHSILTHDYTPTFIESATAADPDRGSAEDMTIAEHLAVMVAPNGHRKGERCFFNDRGERRWVAESEVARFLRKHGEKYPTDFLTEAEHDWKNNFFSGF
jgi:hypothetical protein